jgi:hypothetical protein
MTVHKLHIDEFDEIDYDLVAIHTSLEDYRLAYYINQQLPVLLHKTLDDLQIKNKMGTAFFGRFTFECADSNTLWNLIGNHGEVISKNDDDSPNLFGTNVDIATQVHFLPEYKKVNYFLKIENPVLPISEVILAVNKIERISTVYEVDINKIKSKNNLIF